MIDIINDTATLTTIPVNVLRRLSKKFEDAILYAVKESLLSGETITELDVGVGRLLIKVESDTIAYKFLPSATFEKQLVNTIEGKYLPIQTEVENGLKNKVMNVYKELY